MTLIPGPAAQGPSTARLRLMTLAVVGLLLLLAVVMATAAYLLNGRLQRQTTRLQSQIERNLPGYLDRAPEEDRPLVKALAARATGEAAGFYAAACALASLDLALADRALSPDERALLEDLEAFLQDEPAPGQRGAMDFAEGHPLLRTALQDYAPAAG